VVLGVDDNGMLTLGQAITLPGFTVATLPSCAAGQGGRIAFVNDANAPTYGAPLSGGGTARALALCDGTGWKAH
jgi:hypothetical protein